MTQPTDGLGGVSGVEDIEDLFAAEYSRLVRVLSLADEFDVAADAVQFAFLQGSRHWKRVSRLDDPVGWIYRVAVNRMSNDARNIRRRAELSQRMSGPGTVEMRPHDSDLTDAIRLLPRQQRLSVCLYYIGDLSLERTAEALGVSKGTVKSNLYDARQALRQCLEASHHDHIG